MLKIVLLAYSKGVISSRDIERLCRENVVFMAISGDSAPQFTTIAKFVRTLADDVADVFARVLLACARLGLIERQMFAIDGVKLPRRKRPVAERDRGAEERKLERSSQV
jgi:transposase